MNLLVHHIRCGDQRQHRPADTIHGCDGLQYRVGHCAGRRHELADNNLFDATIVVDLLDIKPKAVQTTAEPFDSSESRAYNVLYWHDFLQPTHLRTSPALGQAAADHTCRLSAKNRQTELALSSGIAARLYPYFVGVQGATCPQLSHYKTRSASHCDALQPASDLHSERDTRCGRVLRSRSRVCGVCGGVPSWEPNRSRGARRCLGERFEQSFEETRGPNDCRSLAASAASFGPTKSRTLSSRSGRAVLSARRNSTSRAIASLPMKRSWSCSTSCARASGHEIQMVSRHRGDGIANPVTRRIVQVAEGPVCSSASGLRPSSGHPLWCAFPVATGHTGGREHASTNRHAFAWCHHLLSDRSGALSPPCTGAHHAGVVRDCGFRKGADGGSPAISDESRAKATKGKAGTAGITGPVRRSTAGTGLLVGEADAARPATSEIMDATAGETALNSVSDGAAYGSLPSGESEPWVTLALAPSESNEGRAA